MVVVVSLVVVVVVVLLVLDVVVVVQGLVVVGGSVVVVDELLGGSVVVVDELLGGWVVGTLVELELVELLDVVDLRLDDGDVVAWELGVVGELGVPGTVDLTVAPLGVVATGPARPVPLAATPGWIEELGPVGSCTSTSEPFPACSR